MRKLIAGAAVVLVIGTGFVLVKTKAGQVGQLPVAVTSGNPYHDSGETRPAIFQDPPTRTPTPAASPPVTP